MPVNLGIVLIMNHIQNQTKHGGSMLLGLKRTQTYYCLQLVLSYKTRGAYYDTITTPDRYRDLH